MVQHYETHHDIVPMQAHHMLIPYMCVYVCVCAECAGQVVVVSYDLLARLVDDNKITPGQFKVRQRPSHVSTHIIKIVHITERVHVGLLSSTHISRPFLSSSATRCCWCV
jgi:hypothetical protein